VLFDQVTTLQQELGIAGPAGPNSEKASLIKNLLGERVLWSQVFKQFSRMVPIGMWFDSLEGTAALKAEIKIKGGAVSYQTISDFMLAMERSSYFEKPQLTFAQKAVVQGRDVIGFEIVCGIKKAQGSP
jgi:Tfp pilus assembly protein PilN